MFLFPSEAPSADATYDGRGVVVAVSNQILEYTNECSEVLRNDTDDFITATDYTDYLHGLRTSTCIGYRLDCEYMYVDFNELNVQLQGVFANASFTSSLAYFDDYDNSMKNADVDIEQPNNQQLFGIDLSVKNNAMGVVSKLCMDLFDLLVEFQYIVAGAEDTTTSQPSTGATVAVFVKDDNAAPSIAPTEEEEESYSNNEPSVVPTLWPSTANNASPESYVPTLWPSMPNDNTTAAASTASLLSADNNPSVSTSPSYTPTYPTSKPTTTPSNGVTLTTTGVTPSVTPSNSPINDGDDSSTYPTVTPSTTPSSTPSATPSVMPSRAPSTSPSSTTPSMRPVIAPNYVPTDAVAPTFQPSSVPSSLHSTTSSPSVEPTMMPSSGATLSPSIVLTKSVTPTVLRSANPTAKTAMVPSFEPTMSPSFAPTFSSLVKPTAMPSNTATLSPSKIYSALKTASPSMFPSMVEPISRPNLSDPGVTNSPIFVGQRVNTTFHYIIELNRNITRDEIISGSNNSVLMDLTKASVSILSNSEDIYSSTRIPLPVTMLSKYTERFLIASGIEITQVDFFEKGKLLGATYHLDLKTRCCYVFFKFRLHHPHFI